MSEIQVGAKGEHRTTVTPDLAIDFLGRPDARVLGTPWMIYQLEMTCRNLIKGFLEEGFDTVGTHVDVKHLAATPLGMGVSFHAEIVSVEDRRVVCRVEAFDDREKIAEGTHERFVINVERFAARTQAKAG